MALVDHVIVLAHLQQQVIAGPPTITYEEQLRAQGHPDEFIYLLKPEDREQRVGIAGEAVVTNAALDIRPSGVRVEVAWPCGCGIGLHVHHEFVLEAWAKHVAAQEGLAVDHLKQHVVQAIEGLSHPLGKPRIHCSCGEWFQAKAYMPNDALAAWEAHVRAA